MDWLGFLKVMMLEEQAARDKYQLALDLAEDPEVKKVFEKLRDEEAFHVDFLQEEYERLKKALG